MIATRDPNDPFNMDKHQNWIVRETSPAEPLTLEAWTILNVARNSFGQPDDDLSKAVVRAMGLLHEAAQLATTYAPAPTTGDTPHE